MLTRCKNTDTHRAMQNVVIRQQANSSVPTAIMTTIKLSFVPAVNQLTTHDTTLQVNNIISETFSGNDLPYQHWHSD